MLQKAYAEGLRALVALHRDRAGRGRRSRRPPATRRRTAARAAQRPAAADRQGRRLRAVLRAARPESLQTFGGSGYLQDYPIEQYIRDAKIDTLYEGTTAIQGLDFFFRKIVRDKGQALATLADRDPGVRQGRRRATARCRRSASCSATALEDVQGIVGDDGRLADGVRRRTSATSTRSGRTPPGCCWPSATWSSAGCCCARPRSRWRRSRPAPTGADAAFYEGKVAAARFFAAPGAAAARRRAGDRRGRRQLA